MNPTRSKRCECGKGFRVLIQYPADTKATESCTWTIREYERQFGKSSAQIVKATASKGGAL